MKGPSLNLVPLLDVFLILILVLMCFVCDARFNNELDGPNAPAYALFVNEDGEYKFMDTLSFNPEELVKMLSQTISRDSCLELHVAPEGKWKHSLHLLSFLHKAGYKKLRFAGGDKKS